MNIFEFRKKDLKDLPVIESDVSFRKKYFAVLLFSTRKDVDGYSPMIVVLTNKDGVAGKMEYHPDSISMEHKDGVTWHMDSIPVSGAMQIWATGGNEIKDLKVWGAGTMYLEAV